MILKKKPPAARPRRASADSEFQLVIDGLKGAIVSNRWIAAGIFVAAAGVGVTATILLPQLTHQSVEELERNSGDLMIGVFVLLRATAFAGVVVAVFWGLLNLARAALDQATRYQKRLMAAHFMHYVFDEYRDQIGTEGFTLREIVNAIDAWSSNVESAFTKVKLGKGKSENWGVSARPDGVKFAYGADAVKNLPSNEEAAPARR